MEEDEPKGSSGLVFAALALVGVVAVGVPVVGVAGLALASGMQASAGGCTPATLVSGEDSADAVINVPNGWGPLVEEAARTAGLPVSVVAAQLQAESNWNPNAGSPAALAASSTNGPQPLGTLITASAESSPETTVAGVHPPADA